MPTNHPTIEITTPWKNSEGNTRESNLGGDNGVGVGEETSKGPKQMGDSRDGNKVMSQAEKKVRRKIKNRESAAKSRARKKV